MNSAVLSALVIWVIAISCAWSQQLGDLSAQQAVERLREIPTPLPATGGGLQSIGEALRIPPAEILRDELYRRLHSLGPDALRTLGHSLHDRDVQQRRSVALTLLVLGEGIWPGLPKLDVSLVLPDLRNALRDSDPDVRAWSAHAIGSIGPGAAPAVRDLVRLLHTTDEGSRISACIALRGIGSAGRAALPALRVASSDSSAQVRRFAQLAIAAIED
jgi:HEAT repeat protein